MATDAASKPFDGARFGSLIDIIDLRTQAPVPMAQMTARVDVPWYVVNVFSFAGDKPPLHQAFFEEDGTQVVPEGEEPIYRVVGIKQWGPA